MSAFDPKRTSVVEICRDAQRSPQHGRVTPFEGWPVKRREFITLVGGAAAAWPFVVNAQPTGKSWRIGQVIGGSAETNGHFARALEQSLDELGYRLG